MVIRIPKGSAATYRHQARVSNLREDHWPGGLIRDIRRFVVARPVSARMGASTGASKETLAMPVSSVPPSGTRMVAAVYWTARPETWTLAATQLGASARTGS
jgi:hypothetical protein